MRHGAMIAAWSSWLVALQGLACSSELPVLTACEPAGGVTPICGFRDPEDLALLPGGAWILASQMGQEDGTPGSLVGYRVADGRLRTLYPPEPGDVVLSSSVPSSGWGSRDSIA